MKNELRGSLFFRGCDNFLRARNVILVAVMGFRLIVDISVVRSSAENEKVNLHTRGITQKRSRS
jgi:hypothetical protein